MTVQHSIETKLQNGLEPRELRVDNESSMHNVPKNSETHFRVLVVADAFERKSRVSRHRAITQLLGDELAGGVHALAIDALTPGEWQERGEAQSTSPDCRGGSSR